MGSALRCLLRWCCEDNEDRQDRDGILRAPRRMRVNQEEDDDCFRPLRAWLRGYEPIHEERTPVQSAKSFDSSSGAIPDNEIVWPGSEMQKEMARTMSLQLEEQKDECVICMEGFSDDNPRMPTECGCGKNHTYFHLPCLFQWTDQNPECPSCRQTLRWEEF